ncbi:MAG TPA: 1-acyl-sn-glycerol-3-phosphate acyltransferase, partial [Candidatus Acidoferrum sp.]
MLRAIFICIFLPLYALLAGPPLLLYTLISRNPEPLYWGGVKGIMFLMRAVGVRVRVRGRVRIPVGACLFVANHTSSADAPAVVGAIPRRVAILLKQSLFKWPIAGQA